MRTFRYYVITLNIFLLSFKKILNFLLEPQYTRKFEISSGPQININESKITLYMKTSLVTLFCYRVSVTIMHLGCALIVKKLWLRSWFRPSYAAVSETTKVKIKKLFVKCKWRITGAGAILWQSYFLFICSWVKLSLLFSHSYTEMI